MSGGRQIRWFKKEFVLKQRTRYVDTVEKANDQHRHECVSLENFLA